MVSTGLKLGGQELGWSQRIYMEGSNLFVCFFVVMMYAYMKNRLYAVFFIIFTMIGKWFPCFSYSSIHWMCFVPMVIEHLYLTVGSSRRTRFFPNFPELVPRYQRKKLNPSLTSGLNSQLLKWSAAEWKCDSTRAAHQVNWFECRCAVCPSLIFWCSFFLS